MASSRGLVICLTPSDVEVAMTYGGRDAPALHSLGAHGVNLAGVIVSPRAQLVPNEVDDTRL